MSGKIYRPDGATLREYLVSRSSLNCIQGPVRSGKSVASIMRLYQGIMEVPETEGKRRSRWLVTRDSYPNLEQSTIKTWLEWFPEALYGRFSWSPPYTHDFKIPGSNVEAEMVFESMSGDDDIPKLKSREYTGAWINEGQFFTLKFVVALYERTGWFPLPGGPKWLQIDMNAPPYGHWAPMMRGDAAIPPEMDDRERRSLIKPDDWRFFTQPAWFTEELDAAGKVDSYKINPKAENLNIVGERAVVELLSGRTKDSIDSELMNRVTIVTTGKPVFPMFRRETHVAKRPLEPTKGVRVVVGLDFGRTPAATCAQCIGGRWFILSELIGDNVGAVTFAPALKRHLAQRYPGFDFEFWGDPAGGFKGQESEQTAFDIFKAHGLMVRAADLGNRRRIRIETATDIMNRLVHGLPALLISPECPGLITAWAGGYVFRRIKVSGAASYTEEPHKNEHSHVSDAAIEMFMGGGESRVTLGRSETKKPINTLKAANPFARSGSAWTRA